MKHAALLTLLAAAFVLAPATSTDAQSYPKKLREMLLTMEEMHVDVNFKDHPLKEVLSFFTTLTDVNLVLSPLVSAERDEDELLVTLTLSRISVRNALSIILELKDLAMVYRHGVIMVTTPKDARGKPKLRLYSIADLTIRIRDFPAPDMMLKPHGVEDWGMVDPGETEGREHAFADGDTIMDLVRENTGGDSWEDEGVSLSVMQDRILVVRTYPSVHREIALLLALLRGYR